MWHASSEIDFRIPTHVPTRALFSKAATSAPEPSNLAIDVDGESIGAIGYVPGVDVERYSAEIGYWLGEAYWRRGIASEALRLVTDTCSTSLNMLRLFALPFADNHGSIRSSKKPATSGKPFSRSSSVKFGRPRDQLLYARINEHWRGVSP